MLTFNSKKGCMDYYSGKTEIHDICSAFHATKLIIPADENDPPILHIEVIDHNNFDFSSAFNLSVPLLADPNELLKAFLANKLPIPLWAKHDLSDYMHQEYSSICKKHLYEYRHGTLGWATPEKNGLKLSCPNPAMPTGNETSPRIFLWQRNSIEGITSLYNDKSFRFSRGSEQEFKTFLKNTVFSTPTLALAITIGYSAVVAALLEEETGSGTLIMNLCGASSTGKSTVQMLMVSPFASPNVNDHGLMRTFQATQNALLAGMGEMHGLPIALDDSSTNPNMNFTNLLYSLAEGQGRQRCNSDGTLKPTKNWSGTVIISSEIPIQEQACENQGLKARVLNLSNIQWTPDAKTAETIKSTVRRCYGHTGYDFALFVSDINFDNLIKSYYTAKDCVHKLMPLRDNLSDRLEAKYAILYLTIQLLNDFFDDLHISLNADELISLALTSEQEHIQERDISQKALNVVSEFIFKKRSHFNEYHAPCTSPYYASEYSRAAQSDVYGTILVKAMEYTDIYMSKSILEAELKQNGIYEIITVLKRWKKDKIILCEKDRLECRMPKLYSSDKDALKRRYIHFVFPKGLRDIPFDYIYITDDEPVPPQDEPDPDPEPEIDPDVIDLPAENCQRRILVSNSFHQEV